MANSTNLSPSLIEIIEKMSTDNVILMDLLLSLFRAYEDNKQLKIDINKCYDQIRIETNHNELVKLSQKRRNTELLLEHINREIERIESEIDMVIEISYSKMFRRTFEKLVDSYKHNTI